MTERPMPPVPAALVDMDIRGDAAYAECLSASSHAASQRLAASLLAAGSSGIVYPSPRRAKGTCLACFRPALVTNVRKGESLNIVCAR